MSVRRACNEPPEIRAAYNTACDNLRNALVEVIVTFTERWRLPAEIEFKDDEGMSFKLRYGRRGSTYGILCVRNEDEVDLLSVNIRVKLLAVECLEQLWQACAEAEVATHARITAATEKAIAWIESKEEKPA